MNQSKPYIMVLPNKPWESPWQLMQCETWQEAKEIAYRYAQQRAKDDPTRYKVAGMTY